MKLWQPGGPLRLPMQAIQKEMDRRWCKAVIVWAGGPGLDPVNVDQYARSRCPACGARNSKSSIPEIATVLLWAPTGVHASASASPPEAC